MYSDNKNHMVYVSAANDFFMYNPQVSQQNQTRGMRHIGDASVRSFLIVVALAWRKGCLCITHRKLKEKAEKEER